MSIVQGAPVQEVLVIDTILLPSSQSVPLVQSIPSVPSAPSIQFIPSVPSAPFSQSVTSKSKVVASVKVILYVLTSHTVDMRVTLAIPFPISHFNSLFKPL